jgi:hypothetical protein
MPTPASMSRLIPCSVVVVLHRLLEPRVAQLLQRAAHPDSALHGVAVVGVEGEREVVADQLAHRPGLGDVAGQVDVTRRLVGVEADLHLAGTELQPVLDDLTDLVDRALAVAADGSVERQLAPPGAAEELPHRLAERLALEIPQRDVDGRQRAGVRALGAELDVLVEQPILKDARLQRVGAERCRAPSGSPRPGRSRRRRSRCGPTRCGSARRPSPRETPRPW